MKEWIGGLSHVHKELGYTKECISLRCDHKILNKMTPYKNSYWVYKEEYENEMFSWDNYLSNFRRKEEITICQYDYKFNLIRKWGSHLELKNAGYKVGAILRICNHSGDARTCDGYIWAYDGYDFSDGYFGHFDEYKKGRHTCRKINMKLEKDGEVINTFSSISEACIFIGKPVEFRNRISAAIPKG